MGQPASGERMVERAERLGEAFRFRFDKDFVGAPCLGSVWRQSTTQYLIVLQFRQAAEEIGKVSDLVAFSDRHIDRKVVSKLLRNGTQTFLPVSAEPLETLRVRSGPGKLLRVTEGDDPAEIRLGFAFTPNLTPLRNGDSSTKGCQCLAPAA